MGRPIFIDLVWFGYRLAKLLTPNLAYIISPVNICKHKYHSVCLKTYMVSVCFPSLFILWSVVEGSLVIVLFLWALYESFNRKRIMLGCSCSAVSYDGVGI